MKKKRMCIAIAGLAAAPVFAQSNVTISGMLTLSYSNYKISNSIRPVAVENRLDDNASRFTLKGSEELDGGLSAYFQIDNRVSVDTRPHTAFGNAQGLADGESFVGLKSNQLGAIGFGKFAMHYHEGLGYSETYRAPSTQMYAATAILGQIGRTDVGPQYLAGNTRQQNAIKYDTPTWNGLSAKLIYSFSPFGNEGTLSNTSLIGGCGSYGSTCVPTPATNRDYNAGYSWNVAGRYFNGPYNLVLSYYRFKPENNVHLAGQESWKMHADYKFPFGLQVGVGYDNSMVEGLTSATDRRRSAWMIPLTYRFGPHAVYLTYAKANSVSGISHSGARQ
ncbi:MAG: porin, partial [Betaproteobacteria bacterium]